MDTKTVRKTVKMLIVADTWCDAGSACDEVWRRIGEQQVTVFVVSPALTSRVHSLVSDFDQEFEAAEQRLNGLLAELREHGYIASGRVGDEDPLRAIKDALYQFEPDELLIVTTSAMDENWRERRLLERAADLGVPVSCVRVRGAVFE